MEYYLYIVSIKLGLYFKTKKSVSFFLTKFWRFMLFLYGIEGNVVWISLKDWILEGGLWRLSHWFWHNVFLYQGIKSVCGSFSHFYNLLSSFFLNEVFVEFIVNFLCEVWNWIGSVLEFEQKRRMGRGRGVGVGHFLLQGIAIGYRWFQQQSRFGWRPCKIWNSVFGSALWWFSSKIIALISHPFPLRF